MASFTFRSLFGVSSSANQAIRRSTNNRERSVQSRGMTRIFVASLQTQQDSMTTRGEGVVSTKEDSSSSYYRNRNPRSLELLGMARKPRGYGTRLWRVDYYHRLMLNISLRHVSGYVDHSNGLKVAEASTKEFCIARHLYKTCDVSAAYNVGRVLAKRCKEMGLYRMMWEHKKDRHSAKVKAFIKAFSEANIVLNEPRPRQIMPPAGKLPKGLNIKTIQS